MFIYYYKKMRTFSNIDIIVLRMRHNALSYRSCKQQKSLFSNPIFIACKEYSSLQANYITYHTPKFSVLLFLIKQNRNNWNYDITYLSIFALQSCMRNQLTLVVTRWFGKINIIYLIFLLFCEIFVIFLAIIDIHKLLWTN